MKWPLVTLAIDREDDVVAARQRARRVAEHLGFGTQDQIRVATAVSEIARNAFGYAGGGKVEYGVEDEGGRQSLVVRISDRGPGIPHLTSILDGRYRSPTGLGLGITGARRLMDRFEIESEPGRGTVAMLTKRLPSGREPFSGPKVASLVAQTVEADTTDPHVALREQNRELLRSLAELAEREEEAQRLNRELGETNRGVVALHAELDAQAGQLRQAGLHLEAQVVARTAELAAANARLKAEAIERERIEESLRQSQKMEAVGQLTGGIAHDFNNLLTGIVGSLDLMQSRMAKGRTDNLHRYVDMAMASANRAAALTHRLLAFARRQPLDPRPTDANALITGMADLLRRSISEAIDLRLVTHEDLWATLCDPNQLENAILNLAINARDAMPDGGTLTIETFNTTLGPDTVSGQPGLACGPYVCVRVTDTGTGMSPDVSARAFDPFFTTKPLGQGTGLGLSMIYGFARQSEGHATIESEVGRGSAISIYLPRHDGGAAAEIVPVSPAEFVDGRGETILVVEDEQIVRELIVDVLTDQGYRVLQAQNGPAGLHALNTGEAIALLLTDVGLPGLNGRLLADQARLGRPDLKILFITGYAESAASSSGFLDPGMAMITKPFSVDTLITRVRDILEER